jgi:hypothetical protein
MKNLTEKFKFTLDKFVPKKVEETPEHIKGLENFKNIVKLLEKRVLLDPKKEKLRMDLRKDLRYFGCHCFKDGKVIMKTTSLPIDTVQSHFPLKSFQLINSSVIESFLIFKNRPFYEDAPKVELFQKLAEEYNFNRMDSINHHHYKDKINVWEVDFKELIRYIDENLNTSQDIYNKIKCSLRGLENYLDEQDIQVLFATHSPTFQCIYDILNDVHETNFTLSPENNKGITEILENFRIALSVKIKALYEQKKITDNIEKKRQDSILKVLEKEKEEKIALKQKNIEEILSIERELQTQYLL